jgi:hypothetical protein
MVSGRVIDCTSAVGVLGLLAFVSAGAQAMNAHRHTGKQYSSAGTYLSRVPKSSSRFASAPFPPRWAPGSLDKPFLVIAAFLLCSLAAPTLPYLLHIFEPRWPP